MTLPDSLIFWLFVPGLFLILAFGWLIYMSRGKRDTRFSLAGMGITITFASKMDPRGDPARRKGGT